MPIPAPRCLVCGNSIEDRHNHVLQSSRHKIGEPLAFTISVQSVYDRSSAVARTLAYARAELREYFPGKEFDIQPVRMMLTKEGENSALLGEAHVAEYVVFER